MWVVVDVHFGFGSGRGGVARFPTGWYFNCKLLLGLVVYEFGRVFALF